MDRDRLKNGHAWMMCRECGVKLYDFDGYKDLSQPCPYKKDERGKCSDELITPLLTVG